MSASRANGICAGKCAGLVSETPLSKHPFIKVTNGRKRPVRGLWRRGELFYARLTIADELGRKIEKRIRLEATTVAEAISEQQKLLIDRSERKLNVSCVAPKFEEYIPVYFNDASASKRPKTVALEAWLIREAAKYFGSQRIDQISQGKIESLRNRMIVDGWSARTGNLFTQAIGNLLRHAKINNHLQTVPKIVRLTEATKRKRLITMSEIEHLCSEAQTILRNGRQFADYIRLLAFSGARAGEASRLKWTDVDFNNGLLTIGSDGSAKNSKPRSIEFNSNLEKHLSDMHSGMIANSVWIFPAARTNGTIHIRSFKCHLRRVFNGTEIQRFGFHHLRHFFASTCVMSGIDFPTVARWLGHSDGGALLAKTYSHLSDEHARVQASKLSFSSMN